MAHIAPFRAWRYDPTRVSLSEAVTQPYDKITPQMQDHYYETSPYNLVRIILGKRNLADDGKNNVYSRAAGHFRDWRQQGVFRQDADPSIYTYSQRFTVPGGNTRLERRGFIALGRLEDYSAGVVYRHEQTLAKPKADRLDLLRATRAHFGQLFMLYEDSEQIDTLLSPANHALIEIEDEYEVLHKVWKVSDPQVIGLVRERMRDQKLIIADGHHRYETALNFRNEQRAARGGTPESPHEFVMMTFINMNSPGLLILPTHRVVHGLGSFSADRFQADASTYFRVEQVDPSIDAPRAVEILHRAGHTSTALLAVTKDRAFLLHSPKVNGSQIFQGLSLRQQALDVVQLHRCLLEVVLGLSEESIRNQQNISYVRDAAEALERVRTGSAHVAFLMNPARMDQVRDIAFAGEILPQKSTDFYPKLLSGLTVYALD
jgi:uncharacterized protein (DUF1015 family)